VPKRSRRLTRARLGLQVADAVAQLRRLLEVEARRGGAHRLVEAGDLGEECFLVLEDLLSLVLLERHRRVVGRDLGGHEIVDRALDALGGDVVLGVVRLLARAAARGLFQRGLHRAGHDVGVEDRGAVQVARRAADRLDERALRAEVPLLVGVQDRDERDLGEIEPFAEEVHADEHVELPLAQVAQDLDALERLDVGVEIFDRTPTSR
jgi:hypothetical protein